jgi:hypothetical protein
VLASESNAACFFSVIKALCIIISLLKVRSLSRGSETSAGCSTKTAT